MVVWVRSLASLSGGSHIAMSYGVGRRCSFDPALLWLWCRLAAAALIRPLPWELPYAAGAALKSAHPPKKKGAGKSPKFYSILPGM